MGPSCKDYLANAQYFFVAKPSAAMIYDPLERYKGCLLGLAVGDALGTTLEFKRPDTFTPIADMLGGGPFRLEPGQWTDDTSMALCLAESLIEKNGFDPDDQMQRYARWHSDGYLSCTGQCFDIGNTVRSALDKYLQDGDPFAGSSDPATAGNGSLMRLAPVPLAFAGNPDEAIVLAAEMSRTTHGALQALDACRYFTGLIIGALQGVSKEDLLHPLYHPTRGSWESDALTRAIENIAKGSFKEKQPPAIRGTGYVVDALEAALWAFYSEDDFRSGALAAVNLGDDADTTGAIFGQLAGAYYGIDGVPEDWVGKLSMSGFIKQTAAGLLRFAKTSREQSVS